MCTTYVHCILSLIDFQLNIKIKKNIIILKLVKISATDTKRSSNFFKNKLYLRFPPVSAILKKVTISFFHSIKRKRCLLYLLSGRIDAPVLLEKINFFALTAVNRSLSVNFNPETPLGDEVCEYSGLKIFPGPLSCSTWDIPMSFEKSSKPNFEYIPQTKLNNKRFFCSC